MAQNKILMLCLILFSFSCSHTPDESHESSSMNVYEDKPFIQEYHEGYVIDDLNSEANDVRAIHVDLNDHIWVATKNGVYRRLPNNSEWDLMIAGKNQGPSYDVISDENGQVWVATWDGVYFYDEDLEKVEGVQPPIAKLVTAKEGIYALGPHGIWLYDDHQWLRKDFTKARSMRAAISDNKGGLWIGTDVGLYHCTDQATTLYQKNEDLISAYVRGLDFDQNGNLWVGGLGGVTIRNGDLKMDEIAPEDGITNAEVNVVKRSPEGKMWVGTNYGITRFTPGQSEYSVRLSKRWLVSNEVRDIAFDQQGNAWIATSEGVSAIKKREITLQQKADYFYDQLIRRHVREPWIVGRFRLEVPGDTSTIVPDDDDNDGEYTAMYLAMESLRYSVTQDPLAKERAEKAFNFLHSLRIVTGMDGFIARTIVPAEWTRMHDMNRTYTPQEFAEEIIKNPRQKPVKVRWHLSKDGDWKWKGDTSSDEMVGHFFGYYWYYNLVANDEEKLRIAHHVSQIVDHLIRNDFYLVGVDGKHTKWGVWSPQSLNNDPEWAPEKALNSLEILSFLKFTHFVTGDDKYQQYYLNLINEEGYLENAKQLYSTNPAWETYFDIYLALYIYPALIQYEEDPSLLKAYREHVDQWFAKFRETRSPLLNFTYNLLTQGNDDLNHSIFFLQDAPLDLVDWEIDNGRREDLHVVRKPILETLQVDELRPASEYRTMRWDRNPYAARAGNPAQEREPVYWLLPYWLGRYIELIE
jgi:streptogramin lyase